MTTPHLHVGGIDFVTVFVSDFAAATEFYGTTLGLRCSSRYERVVAPSSRLGT
jgi:catechol 2,3-dioxygenase-like lactoylglutathione lyase family enzyme